MGRLAEFIRTHPWDAFAVAGLMLLGLVVILWTRREPIFSDDIIYFGTAADLLDGTLGPRLPNGYRLGLIGPVAAAQAVAGQSALAYYLVPVVFGVLTPVAVYLFGRLFFPVWVAAASGGLLVTQPLFLADASTLLPDWPATVWFVIALGAAVRALRDGHIERHARMRWVTVSAVAFYFSTFTKEAMLPLGVALIAVVWAVDTTPEWRRLMLRGAAVGLACFLVESFIWMIVSGDPLARVDTVLSGHLSSASEGWVELGETWTWPSLASRYIVLLAESLPGFMLLAGSVVALLIALVTRDRRLMLLGVVAVLGYLYVSLTVVSLDPLSPLLRTKGRYFSVVVVFLPLLVVGAVSVALDRVDRNRRLARALIVSSTASLVMVSAVAGIAVAADRPQLARNGADILASTSSAVIEVGDAGLPTSSRLYTDLRTAGALRLFVPGLEIDTLDYNRGFSAFDYPTAEPFATGDVVLLNLKRLAFNERRYWDEPLPPWVTAPPAGWVMLDESPVQGSELWYVVSDDRVERNLVEVTPSLVRNVDGEPVPVLDGRVLVGGKERLDSAAIVGVPDGTDLVVVMVRAAVLSGEIEDGRTVLALHDAAGEVLFRQRLRAIPSAAGIELTAAIPLYAGVGVEGYSLVLRLKGDGAAALNVSVATLDLGFDRMRLSWPPGDPR